ncbi:MAG: winged helix-turn-helix domain-containing protein [Halioglobus sp.]
MEATNTKMHASGVNHRSFLFGEFVLDVDRGALLLTGADVPLRPKSFEVLNYLVRHAGLLISKEELLSAIWPHVVVTEDSLTHCLMDIRRVLDDDAHEIVRTVRGRGYLFDLPVAVHERDEGLSIVSRNPAWSVRLLAIAAVLMVVLASAVWLADDRNGRAAVPTAGAQRVAAPTSIAVLPFVDMSEHGDQAYFADGISEEVLNLLAQAPDLLVIARTSSFSFRGQNLDIASIAQQLNVAHVLEGSVRRDGEQIRVTAQLVKASDSTHLWSQTYDHALPESIAVQQEIAAEVAKVLKVKLLGGAAVATTRSTDAAAYEHFLKGKFFYSRRGQGDNKRAFAHFERAIAIDPGLADAWVGLAGSLGLQIFEQEIPWREGLARKRAALEQALLLDPNNAEAHIRMSYVAKKYLEEDRAREHADLAWRYGQNSALVLSIFAGIASSEAELDQAVALQRRAAALDPLGFANRANLATYLYFAGRLDESREQFINAIALNPEMADELNADILMILLLQHNIGEAEDLLEQLPPGNARDQAHAMTYHLRGLPAESAVARLSADASIDSAKRLVDLHAYRMDADKAFYWINVATERSFDTEHIEFNMNHLEELSNSPFLRLLHDDSRWLEWRKSIEVRTAQSLASQELASLD